FQLIIFRIMIDFQNKYFNQINRFSYGFHNLIFFQLFLLFFINFEENKKLLLVLYDFILFVLIQKQKQKIKKYTDLLKQMLQQYQHQQDLKLQNFQKKNSKNLIINHFHLFYQQHNKYYQNLNHRKHYFSFFLYKQIQQFLKFQVNQPFIFFLKKYIFQKINNLIIFINNLKYKRRIHFYQLKIFFVQYLSIKRIFIQQIPTKIAFFYQIQVFIFVIKSNFTFQNLQFNQKLKIIKLKLFIVIKCNTLKFQTILKFAHFKIQFSQVISTKSSIFLKFFIQISYTTIREKSFRIKIY
ncbi:hypothetical protein IMG5_158480, partial [Ichthyophthirius multifiliis]